VHPQRKDPIYHPKYLLQLEHARALAQQLQHGGLGEIPEPSLAPWTASDAVRGRNGTAGVAAAASAAAVTAAAHARLALARGHDSVTSAADLELALWEPSHSSSSRSSGPLPSLSSGTVGGHLFAPGGHVSVEGSGTAVSKRVVRGSSDDSWSFAPFGVRPPQDDTPPVSFTGEGRAGVAAAPAGRSPFHPSSTALELPGTFTAGLRHRLSSPGTSGEVPLSMAVSPLHAAASGSSSEGACVSATSPSRHTSPFLQYNLMALDS
jgi:hypothetical protein